MYYKTELVVNNANNNNNNNNNNSGSGGDAVLMVDDTTNNSSGFNQPTHSLDNASNSNPNNNSLAASNSSSSSSSPSSTPNSSSASTASSLFPGQLNAPTKLDESTPAAAVVSSQVPVKRKSSDHHAKSKLHHNNHHHHHHHHSSSSAHLYHHKPVYSEKLSSKCDVFIYYKGDLALVVEDHFKKSFSAPSKNGHRASVSSLTKSKLAQTIKSDPSMSLAKRLSNSSTGSTGSHTAWSRDQQSIHLSTTNLNSYTPPNAAYTNYETWPYCSSAVHQYNNYSQQPNSNQHPLSNSAYSCSSNQQTIDVYSGGGGGGGGYDYGSWNRTAADLASFYSNQAVTQNVPKLQSSSSSLASSTSPPSSVSSTPSSSSTNTSANLAGGSFTHVVDYAGASSSFDTSNSALLSAFQSQNIGLENNTSVSYTTSHSPIGYSSNFSAASASANCNSGGYGGQSGESAVRAAKAAAVAAVAANQYLSASFNAVSSVAAAAAAAAAVTNHHHTYHNRYSHYHFDLAAGTGYSSPKQSITAQLECKRTASSHLNYSGFEFNNGNEQMTNTGTNGSSHSYASTIWY